MDLIPLAILSVASFAAVAVLSALRGFRLVNLLLGSLSVSVMLAAISWPAVDGQGEEAVKVAVGVLAGTLFAVGLERERVRKLNAPLGPAEQPREATQS